MSDPGLELHEDRNLHNAYLGANQYRNSTMYRPSLLVLEDGFGPDVDCGSCGEVAYNARRGHLFGVECVCGYFDERS